MRTVNIRTVELDEIRNLPSHPVADIFPMLAETSSDRETGKVDKQTITLTELAGSIVDHGQQEPIVLFTDEEGKRWLLDGRNRRAACIKAKVETVIVEDFEGSSEEAGEYVLNLNVDRRDLTPGQRAYAAAKFWEMEAEKARQRQGARTDIPSNLTGSFKDTRDVLSSRFRVSNSYVDKAHKELDAINEARLRAEKLQQEAAEQEAREKEAEAKIELAKVTGNADIVKEAVVEKSKAAEAKTDLRERAAEAAEAAATRERRANRVQKGETFNSVYGEKKQETVSDDPVAKLRTRLNSSVANIKATITELAEITARGEDDHNYIVRKLNDLSEHFQAEFK